MSGGSGPPIRLPRRRAHLPAVLGDVAEEALAARLGVADLAELAPRRRIVVARDRAPPLPRDRGAHALPTRERGGPSGAAPLAACCDCEL